MKIIFSDHARLKMRERKLSERSVLVTIDKPARVEHMQGGREALYRKFRKLSLKIVIVRRRDVIIVVTAHWVA